LKTDQFRDLVEFCDLSPENQENWLTDIDTVKVNVAYSYDKKELNVNTLKELTVLPSDSFTKTQDSPLALQRGW
jgi:hypothetical protein